MKLLQPRQPGVTLVEVVLAMAIVAILLGLLLPIIGAVRERANVTICQNQLKQLGLATHQYYQVNKALPPYASGRGSEINGSWFVHLMPYCGYESLYEEIATLSRTHTTRRGLRTVGVGDTLGGGSKTVFAGMLCPSDPSGGAAREPGRINYLANWFAFGNGQKAYGDGQKLQTFDDGLGNTVLFAEAYANCNGLPRRAMQSSYYHNFGITQDGKASDDPAYLPSDYTMFQVQPRTSGTVDLCDKLRTQTPHRAMHVGLADGSVHTIAGDISLPSWKGWLKPRDAVTN